MEENKVTAWLTMRLDLVTILKVTVAGSLYKMYMLMEITPDCMLMNLGNLEIKMRFEKMKENWEEWMVSPLSLRSVEFIHWQGQRVDGSCDPSSSFCTLFDRIIRPPH